MTDRIQTILRSLNLSPSQLADAISVQRSSLSHILSGRNKPSLDFITKVLTSYPQIDPDWLLFGKGSMLREEGPPPRYGSPSVEKESVKEQTEAVKVAQTEEPAKNDSSSNAEARGRSLSHLNKGPVQIILLYDDNTYGTYNPS